VSQEDVFRALKREAKIFFERENLEKNVDDMEAKLFQSDEEEEEEEDVEQEEEEEEQQEEEEEQQEKEEQEVHTYKELVDDDDSFSESQCQCSVCLEINAVHTGWDEWEPEHEVSQFLKHHVEKAIRQVQQSKEDPDADF
jgi:hypothetical protein